MRLELALHCWQPDPGLEATKLNNIKNKVNNSSFEFLSQNLLNEDKSQPLVSLPGENNVVSFISNSTSSNIFNLTDTYPFTNFTWVKKYFIWG